MRLGLWLSCVYLFAVYFRPQQLYPELLLIPNLMDILGALAVGATFLDLAAGRRPRLWQPQIWLLTFFVLWAGFSVAAASRWLGGALIAFGDLSINGFVFFIVVLHGAELSRIATLRRTFIAALLVTVAFGFRAYYWGPRQAEFVLFEKLRAGQTREDAGTTGSAVSRLTAGLTGRGAQAARQAQAAESSDEGNANPGRSEPTVPRLRALGLLNDPNDLAQTLIAALPLVFVSWRPRRHLGNLLLVLLPAGAMLWAVALTRSRGGMVALAALLWFAFAQWASPRWSRALRWTGFLGLYLLLILFFRLGAADESALGRLDAWSEGLQMLKYSPVWGVGFGSFADVHGIVAHNSFVHCFGELGLVGYFLWLGAILATVWHLELIKAAEGGPDGSPELLRWANAASLSLLAFLAGALFLSRTYSVSLFLLVGLGTAIAGVSFSTSHVPERRSFSLGALTLRTSVLVVVSVVLTYLVVVLGR